MPVRDFQRSKVYKAEAKVDHGSKFKDVKDMQDYCDRMTKSKWWQSTYPAILKITVRDGRGRSSAAGFRSREGIVVKMPMFARNELILLHEISHGLKPVGVAWHGKEYCGEYIKIVRHFMGVKAGKDLQDSFDSHGVLYTEPEKPIPTSKYRGMVKLSWNIQKERSSQYVPEYRKFAKLGEHLIGTVAKDPKWTEGKYRAWCSLITKARGILGVYDTEEQAMKVVEDTVNMWLYKAGIKIAKD